MATPSQNNNTTPTTLDYILAFTPLPVIGEIKARKVAEHIADQDYCDYPEYDREKNVRQRYRAARMFAYIIPYGVIAGGFAFYQAM